MAPTGSKGKRKEPVVLKRDLVDEDFSLGLGKYAPSKQYLPCTPLVGVPVVFKDINCVINEVQSKKTVLHRVNGHLEPGKFTLLLGPSGSGKTSLVDILSGRKTEGIISGEVQYGGEQPTKQFLRAYTAYVEQFDSLIDNLTVYEMLMYTAELRNYYAEPLYVKASRVEGVMSTLGLTECRNTIIGSRLNRGISGGELKRTNIGLALVGSPSVLFLDEPSSGLDSFTAEEVMGSIRSLADRGLTVCASLHAPSPVLSAMCDHLLILLHGRLVYGGPNGSDVQNYFSEACTSRKPIDMYDIGWITKIIVLAGRQAGQAAKLEALYAHSHLAVQVKGKMSDMSTHTPGLSHLYKGKSNPAWWSIRTLLKYRMPANYKTPAFWQSRVLDKILFAFIMATLYWRVAKRIDDTGTLNTSAALFMWALLPGFASIKFLPSLVTERVLFIRERNDGLYTAAAYLCHKFIEEVVWIGAISIVFSTITWYSLGLHGSLVLYTSNYFLATCTGITLGYFMAAMSPSMEIAQVATAGSVIVLIFFAGMLMRFQDMPWWWSWFSKFDFLRYAWGSLMINQFENSPKAIWPFVYYHPLEYLGFEFIDKWAYVGYVGLNSIVFGLAAWAALAWMPHGRR